MGRNNRNSRAPMTMREKVIMGQELVQIPSAWLERGYPGKEQERGAVLMAEPLNMQYARGLMKAVLEMAERTLKEQGPAVADQMSALCMRQVAVITDSTHMKLAEDDPVRHQIELFLLRMADIIEPSIVTRAARNYQAQRGDLN